MTAGKRGDESHCRALRFCGARGRWLFQRPDLRRFTLQRHGLVRLYMRFDREAERTLMKNQKHKLAKRMKTHRKIKENNSKMDNYKTKNAKYNRKTEDSPAKRMKMHAEGWIFSKYLL